MRCVPNKRFLDREAKRMEEEGRRLAMLKHQEDGKAHRVRVIESHWQEWLFGAMTRNCKTDMHPDIDSIHCWTSHGYFTVCGCSSATITLVLEERKTK